VRDKVAQVPARTQGFLDAAGDSDAVTCILPVIIVGGAVLAIIGGGPIGSLNFCPATPSP